MPAVVQRVVGEQLQLSDEQVDQRLNQVHNPTLWWVDNVGNPHPTAPFNV